MRRLVVISVVVLGLLGGAAAGSWADAQQVQWTGNGLDSVTQCVKPHHSYLHWVLTPGGTPVDGTTAELYVNGIDRGTMVPNGSSGALQLTIQVSKKLSFEKLEDAVVYAQILTGSVGDGSVLTISDGCLCGGYGG
jgi:hypothetical protein